MWRLLGIAISAIAICGGVAGIFRPELFCGSMEGAYSRTGARFGAIILLLLGLAGLIAILADGAGEILPGLISALAAAPRRRPSAPAYSPRAG